MDTVYFKKDIVSINNAFNELEKVRLNHKPTKKVWVLDQSNNSPDMMNTIRNNNAYEDNFWKNHNKYRLTPHIDSKPKYTSPYYAPQETGYGSFNYTLYMQNLKII